MIVVGELINSTRKKIKEAMTNRDAAYLKDLARKQDEAGADFIDVNAGAFVDDEMEILEWALKEVMGVTEKPIAVDSPRGENKDGFGDAYKREASAQLHYQGERPVERGVSRCS